MKKLLVFVLLFFSFNSKAEEFVCLLGLNILEVINTAKIKKENGII